METMLLEETEKKAARVQAIAAVDMTALFGTLAAALVGGIVLSQTAYTSIGAIFAASSALSLVFLIVTLRVARESWEPKLRPLLTKADTA